MTKPGYDAVIQAEGGLMSVTGDADGPAYRLGVAITDIVAGHVRRAGHSGGVVSRASTTGAGQIVDIGMLDATAALLTYQAGNYFATGEAPKRLGNRHPTIVPYELFETSDGEIVIAVGNDEIWRRFCAAADLPAVGADPRFATNRDRVEHYDGAQADPRPRFADADARRMAALPRRRRRAVRLGPRRRRGARRSAAGRARDGRRAASSNGRTDQRRGIADQAVGHAVLGSDAATDAGTASRGNPERAGLRSAVNRSSPELQE